MDENILEQVYQEKLEERIIAQIAKEKTISLEKAMDIYYGSELADKIHNGKGFPDEKMFMKLCNWYGTNYCQSINMMNQ